MVRIIFQDISTNNIAKVSKVRSIGQAEGSEWVGEVVGVVFAILLAFFPENFKALCGLERVSRYYFQI